MLCNLQDQYVELTGPLSATDRVFGLGERTPSAGMELLRDGLPYALWAHDVGAAFPDQNLYGSHPMLLIVHEGARLSVFNGHVVLRPYEASYVRRSFNKPLSLQCRMRVEHVHIAPWLML